MHCCHRKLSIIINLNFTGSLSAIPREVIAIPNVMAQLDLAVENPSGNQISGAFVMQAAAAFQQNASSVRLGLPAPRKPNPGLFKAIGASASIKQERKDKREAAGNLTIRISAALWQLPAPVNVLRGKMQEVGIIIFVAPICLSLTARAAHPRLRRYTILGCIYRT
jgi:hypothetical protein